MLLTVLTAYPLSRRRSEFRFRNAYSWFFVLTMLFSGGLIPWYMTIKMTGIIDTFWALVLPGAVPVLNVILMLNFFKSLGQSIHSNGTICGILHGRFLSLTSEFPFPIRAPESPYEASVLIKKNVLQFSPFLTTQGWSFSSP